MIFKMYNDYTIDLSHYNLPIRKVNYLDDKIKDDFTGIEITNSVKYRFIKEGMIHRVGGPAVVSYGSYLASQLNVVLMKLRESFALCLEVREDDKKHIFAISGCGVVEITNF